MIRTESGIGVASKNLRASPWPTHSISASTSVRNWSVKRISVSPNRSICVAQTVAAVAVAVYERQLDIRVI